MKKQVSNLFKYLIVGGSATIVEWCCFYILSSILDVQYLGATAIAFIFSTFANWRLGRLLVFNTSTQSLIREIGAIYIASAMGLILNLCIMFVLVQIIKCDEMFSKIVATLIVFGYNYFVRKRYIYKNLDQ